VTGDKSMQAFTGGKNVLYTFKTFGCVRNSLPAFAGSPFGYANKQVCDSFRSLKSLRASHSGDHVLVAPAEVSSRERSLHDRLSVCVDDEKGETHKCAESNLSHTLLASHREKLFIFSLQ